MYKLFVVVMSLFVSGALSAAEPKQPAKPAVAKAKPQALKTAAVQPAALAASPVPDVKVQEAVAGQVHTGHMVCELGNSVTVTANPQQPNHFIVKMNKHTFAMSPVETTTGAVRLEDAQAGAMWLQLPNKSMLMNSKLGQRMADECQSDQQTAVAQRMKLDPPPSLLDQPTLATK
jgi:glucose/arabinose dehydrogenase